MSLFCVSGQMRSGKNAVGEYISSQLGIETASFAKPVKEIFCNTFGVDLEFLENWKVKNTPPPGFQKTVRQSLQFIGDGFRSINPNVWVEYAFSNNSFNICYTDGRYINELEYVKKNKGINILLYRPSYENNDSNESEAQIKRLVDWFLHNSKEGDVRELNKHNLIPGCDLIDFFIINDSDLKSLYHKINKIII